MDGVQQSDKHSIEAIESRSKNQERDDDSPFKELQMSLFEQVWQKKAELLKVLEQARKGIQSLEEEFTKNQDGLIALRSRINNELNFSNESIHEEDDDIDSMVKQIESKDLEPEDTNRSLPSEDNDQTSQSLQELIEPSPNSVFLKEILSSSVKEHKKNSDNTQHFNNVRNTADRYGVENEIKEVDEENEVDSDERRYISRIQQSWIRRAKQNQKIIVESCEESPTQDISFGPLYRVSKIEVPKEELNNTKGKRESPIFKEYLSKEDESNLYSWNKQRRDQSSLSSKSKRKRLYYKFTSMSTTISKKLSIEESPPKKSIKSKPNVKPFSHTSTTPSRKKGMIFSTHPLPKFVQKNVLSRGKRPKLRKLTPPVDYPRTPNKGISRDSTPSRPNRWKEDI